MNTSGQMGGKTPGTPPPGDSAGYRRPPISGRFQKGKSGNPTGRQPGSKNKKPAQPGPLELTLAGIVLDELLEPVTVLEGGKPVAMSGYRANIRSVKLAGIKGNRLAAKFTIELAQKAEAQKIAAHALKLKETQEYVSRCYREMERCRVNGLPEPFHLPHPADIEIDDRTGKFEILGPVSVKEKVWWDFQIEERTAYQVQVSAAAAKHATALDAETKDAALADWHSAQRCFDLLNDRLRGRYRANLDDRSNRPGASRENDFQTERDVMRTKAELDDE